MTTKTETKPDEKPNAPESTAAAADMVPKADLLKAHGKAGELTRKLNALESEKADLLEQIEALKSDRKGAPTDEEREGFEKELRETRSLKRQLEAREKEINAMRRDALLTSLTAKYPNVTVEELQAQAEMDDKDLRIWATETHYERRDAADAAAKAKEPPAPAKPAAPASRMDSSGSGAGSTVPQQMTSAEMKQRGLQKHREDNQAAYQAAGLT